MRFSSYIDTIIIIIKSNTYLLVQRHIYIVAIIMNNCRLVLDLTHAQSHVIFYSSFKITLPGDQLLYSDLYPFKNSTKSTTEKTPSESCKIIKIPNVERYTGRCVAAIRFHTMFRGSC